MNKKEDYTEVDFIIAPNGIQVAMVGSKAVVLDHPGIYDVQFNGWKPYSVPTGTKVRHSRTRETYIFNGHTWDRFKEGADLNFHGLTKEMGFSQYGDPAEISKCECGAHSINSHFHSDWCPKYQEFK